MHITIVAVGQKLPAWAQTAVDDYLARFPRDFTVIVKEVKAEARTGGKPVAQVMAAEAERIERAVPAGDILVAMDEHGRDMTTVDFSKKISGWKNEGCGVTFIIGGADGPTAIFLTSRLAPEYMGAIAICAYSYMALVPVIQPPVMRLLTSQRERLIKMRPPRAVSSTEKILFPIIGFLLTTFVVPDAIPLLGMLFLGNLLKESGVVKRLATTASNQLIDIMTILIGITVGASTQASVFLTPKTLGIFVLGACSFFIATMGGVLFVKLMNLFLKEGNKINPLIGNAGVSAVPAAAPPARVSQDMGIRYDRSNYLLMHAMGPNVAGVVGSAVAAGILLSFLG